VRVARVGCAGSALALPPLLPGARGLRGRVRWLVPCPQHCACGTGMLSWLLPNPPTLRIARAGYAARSDAPSPCAPRCAWLGEVLLARPFALLMPRALPRPSWLMLRTSPHPQPGCCFGSCRPGVQAAASNNVTPAPVAYHAAGARGAVVTYRAPFPLPPRWQMPGEGSHRAPLLLPPRWQVPG
jgi:hypothetical protein